MAKKTRKQKQRAATRRPLAPTRDAGTGNISTPVRAPVPGPLPATVMPMPGTGGEIETELEPVAAHPAPAQGQRRRIERVSPTATGRTARQPRGVINAAALFQPLEGDDAAIPFDRVPYVPRDLRRVAAMAGLMVVLIIIAAVIVSHVVT